MTLDEMKNRKKEMGLSCKKISELSKVPIGTVQKIFGGKTTSPRYDTIQALAKVLSGETKEGPVSKNFYEYGTAFYDDISYVNEPQPEYNISPIGITSNAKINTIDSYTIDDYMALPEGTRVELIDGRFYNMAAPTTIHQNIGSELWAQFKNFIQKNGGKCVPFVSPIDVQLDLDDKTMVQPDVIVVCDRDKITKARILGAPDLVIEIVSPSDISMDVYIKMLKYQNAGVREYWIVFPEEKAVMVYDFEKQTVPKTYSFEDSIPVGIWGGKCLIDFKYIYSQVEFIYAKPE